MIFIGDREEVWNFLAFCLPYTKKGQKKVKFEISEKSQNFEKKKKRINIEESHHKNC